MGGFETWGFNTNKDGFTVKELLKSYKTFEKAHCFTQHCFPAGTPVLLADRRRVPIEDVVVGDVVETLEGPKPVTALMRREYSGGAVAVRVRGVPGETVMTEDHKVLTYRREQIHCSHKYSRIAVRDPQKTSGHGFHCKEIRAEVGEPSWVEASSILPGDYVVVPIPRHGDVDVEPWFAELVGWVASDGYLGENGQIAFTFSEKNSSDIASVISCLKAAGLNVSVSGRPKYGVVAISACSKKIHERLSTCIVGKFSEKTMTAEVMAWNRQSLLRMLGAYIDGDGSVQTVGRRGAMGTLRIRSSSPGMLSILSDIVCALGYPASICLDKPEASEMISPTNGKRYVGAPGGCVVLPGRYVHDIAVYSRKRPDNDFAFKTVPRNRIVSGAQILAVAGVDHFNINETVYDIEVDGPHHFVAGEFVVHNCNTDPSKARGTVPLALWNPVMVRVELIIELPHDRNEDWLNEIERGEAVGCSMGTKCDFDVCSWCGNRAKNPSEYCSHIKNHLGDIDEDGSITGKIGTICGMMNVGCNFFDISKVRKPADKSAYTLAKIASQCAEDLGDFLSDPYAVATGGDVYGMEKAASDVPPSVQAFEIRGRLNEKRAARKIADIVKDVPGEVLGLTDAEDAFMRFQRDAMPRLRATEPEIDHDGIAALLDSYGGKGKMLSTLAHHGVVLKPKEFQATALIDDDLRDVADRLAKDGVLFDAVDEEKSDLDDVGTDGISDVVDISALKRRKGYHLAALLERLHDALGAEVPEKRASEAPTDPRDVQALRKIAGMWTRYVKQASAIALNAISNASMSPSISKYAQHLPAVAFGYDPICAASDYSRAVPRDFGSAVKMASAMVASAAAPVDLVVAETYALGMVKAAARKKEPGNVEKAFFGRTAGQPLSDKALAVLVAGVSAAGAVGGGYLGYKLAPEISFNPVAAGIGGATLGGGAANLGMLLLADQLDKHDKAEQLAKHLSAPPMVVGVPGA